MRLYYEIALRSFRRASTYRSSVVAGALTNAFFGALMSFVYQAIYANGGTMAGFTMRDAISYTWITQSLLSIGAGWINPDIMRTIRSGDVITDLSRPWHFYTYWLSRTLGENAFNLLIRGSFTYLVGVLYFNAYVPALPQLAAFAVAISLAVLVLFAFSFIVNLSAFWLIDSTGVMLMANILLSFFSGFILPLAFFPAPLAAIAAVLPFQAINSLPALVLLGKIGRDALGGALLLQMGWALALTLLALLALRAAMHKVVIQGG